MTTRRTHGVHLATGAITVLLAVPVLGVLLWGAWRLLFWGVVAVAPHAQYGPAAGMTTPSAIPPGIDTMFAGGGLSGTGSSLSTLVAVGVVVVVVLLASVAVTPRAGDDLATLEETAVHGGVGEGSDEEVARRRRRALTGDPRDRTS
ncbi:hypothetical protein [Salinigranum marinum]|uniref:hypothetical protein n=1 Tax=Salinigranum marinum TaxID=1515595 RepID=UPI002989D641|nr:hypothetical protein [Salinigranum marinum]